MSHNIETNGDKAAFVSAREVPWHRLGTVTPDAMTADDAARLAHLADWNVRKVPLVTSLSDDPTAFTDAGLFVPKKVATVRTNPFDGTTNVLGVVGEGYKVIQNEEAFEVLNFISDEGGAHFETAGSLGNGERVFMSMKMPEGIEIDGADAHELYLLATNSHDGSSAFTVAVTPVRVVCQNTLTWGLQSAKQKWTLRHTANVEGRIAEARASLKLTYKYAGQFADQMKALLEQDFTNAEFDRLVKDVLIPDTQSEHEGWQARADAQRAQLTSLFRDADTQDFGRGTKYAAANAIAEYADWFMPVKGDDPDGSRRASRAMEGGTVQAFKSKGLAALV